VSEDAIVRTALQYLKDRGLGPQLAQVQVDRTTER
jgi:hypothetical protein